MSIKWAIIGTDESSIKFAQGIKKSTGNALEVVVDEDHYNAFYYAKCCGAPTYSADLKGILENDDIKSVYISQIDPTNVEFALKCLKSGKSVVYERVFMSIKQLNELKIRDKNSKSLFTNNQLNFNEMANFV